MSCAHRGTCTCTCTCSCTEFSSGLIVCSAREVLSRARLVVSEIEKKTMSSHFTVVATNATLDP